MLWFVWKVHIWMMLLYVIVKRWIGRTSIVLTNSDFFARSWASRCYRRPQKLVLIFSGLYIGKFVERKKSTGLFASHLSRFPFVVADRRGGSTSLRGNQMDQGDQFWRGDDIDNRFIFRLVDLPEIFFHRLFFDVFSPSVARLHNCLLRNIRTPSWALAGENAPLFLHNFLHSTLFALSNFFLFHPNLEFPVPSTA